MAKDIEIADGVLDTEALDALQHGLSGWAILASPDLGAALMERGATLLRQAVAMSWDLTTADLDPAWRDLHLSAPLTVEPVVADWTRIVASHEVAYPATHPDHELLADAATLQQVLEGTVVGPLHPDASAWVSDGAGEVVAGITVTMQAGDPPFGGPWVADVWRTPVETTRGLGSALIRRAAGVVHDEGHETLGLAVTSGNPAMALYERLGFVVTDDSMTVALP